MQHDCLIRFTPGDHVRVVRPDGSFGTLLRHSPTLSRSPDVFVQPQVEVFSSDELVVVSSDDHPGFVLIATSSGDIGYVQVSNALMCARLASNTLPRHPLTKWRRIGMLKLGLGVVLMNCRRMTSLLARVLTNHKSSQVIVCRWYQESKKRMSPMMRAALRLAPQ